MKSLPAPRVTVVVLSYNRPRLLEHALRSILTQTISGMEVIVVDNRSASSEEICHLVATFQNVRLVANRGNLGFTGGMNRGLGEARGEYVYLTEDDVELAPDCLAHLIEYLDAHHEVALAGPVMWNRRAGTVRCAGGEFDLGAVYRMRIVGAGAAEAPQKRPFPTMYLPGAAIGARTSQLRDLGGFRDDFFMYGEDVELCARALKRGRRLSIVPAAKVFHHEPPHHADSPVVAYHKFKNLGALYLLHAPLRVLPMWALRYAGIAGIRQLLGDRSALVPWVKAWIWLTVQAPGLLVQRGRT
ncbi:MAG: glycosyltransferase family 2 protein [Acidobacteria bacterium]|nr:MAG: glycosyltransferase family 2 protein [Acidobacteriota bacterium]